MSSLMTDDTEGFLRAHVEDSRGTVLLIKEVDQNMSTVSYGRKWSLTPEV